MSFNYSGSGQALVVREKCNADKPFTSSSVLTNTTGAFSRIISYENSIIGKRLLSGQIVNTYPLNLIASDSLLNFRIIPYTSDSGSYIVIYTLMKRRDENTDTIDRNLMIVCLLSFLYWPSVVPSFDIFIVTRYITRTHIIWTMPRYKRGFQWALQASKL